MLRTGALFAAAAAVEIGGVFLIWRGLRDGAGAASTFAGMLSLAAYGLLASLQSDPHFGRVLAAYGGVFVAGSLAWGVVFDRFHPDARDLLGSAVCLLGAAIIIGRPS